MVSIQQDFTLSELDSLLLKFGSTTLSFNRQAIQDDIDRLKRDLQVIIASSISNKEVNKKNINNIISYLERLLKKADKGPITIGWTIDNNIIKSYPIEMKSIPEYKIYTTDYINLHNEHIVYMDYKELADIIAFEIMYRDLDETHDTIEEKLRDIGIIAVSNSKILTKHFTESPYELSKILRISDSPYLIPGSNAIVDYFGKKEFKDKAYREVVSHSCRAAMAFVIESLLQKTASHNMKFKICGVFDTGIYLLVENKADSYIQDDLGEPVYIRTFGRKLEVKPKIQVF